MVRRTKVSLPVAQVGPNTLVHSKPCRSRYCFIKDNEDMIIASRKRCDFDDKEALRSLDRDPKKCCDCFLDFSVDFCSETCDFLFVVRKCCDCLPLRLFGDAEDMIQNTDMQAKQLPLANFSGGAYETCA